MHDIVGYQLAQAAIVTSQVFEERVGGTSRAGDGGAELNADGDAAGGRPGGALRRVEFTVLSLVHGNPGVTARQIARALAVTPPNISLVLDRLVARGLIERERGARDGRLQHLRATQAGVALAGWSRQALLEREGVALAHLSAAERAMLVELLHKVALGRRGPET